MSLSAKFWLSAMFGSYVLICHFTIVTGLPTNYLKRVAESNNFDDFENYLPKYDDLPHYQFPSNELEDEVLVKHKQNYNKSEKATQINQRSSNGTTFNIDSPQVSKENMENSTVVTVYPEMVPLTTSFLENSNNIMSEGNNSSSQMEPNFELISSKVNDTNRLPRQELNDSKSDPEFESQEEGSSEENGNMLTGLLSAFLGGFSKPDGSVDVEAIVGLLGSLSTQNDDGSYDFQGLTDLLRGFFGGGGDEGGGSDIGAFVGGLLGAIIKGVANPPGAKGAGIFTGKIVAGVLPALSGPAPPDADMDNKPPPQGLDSGGFLSGLLKTILGSSSGGGQEEGGGSNIFKIIFSLISSIFSSSSKKQ